MQNKLKISVCQCGRRMIKGKNKLCWRCEEFYHDARIAAQARLREDVFKSAWDKIMTLNDAKIADDRLRDKSDKIIDINELRKGTK